MRIQIDLKDAAVKAALDKIAKKVNNLQPAMFQAGIYMERQTKLNFAQESDPDGAPWAPLKASTLRSKRTSAILRETSTLAGGISLTSATKTKATIQATAGSEYGIFIQTGTSKMSSRKFIGIGDRHIPKVRQIFEKFLSP